MIMNYTAIQTTKENPIMATNKKQRRTSTAPNRAAILSPNKLAPKKVNLPEWGEDVYVRSIRASEFNSFRSTLLTDGQVNEDEMMARLVTLTACDSKGKRIFNDKDWAQVNKLPLSQILPVFRVALKLNNLDDDDIKELVKN